MSAQVKTILLTSKKKTKSIGKTYNNKKFKTSKIKIKNLSKSNED